METNSYTTREEAVAASARFVTTLGGKTHLPGTTLDLDNDGEVRWAVSTTSSACGAAGPKSNARSRAPRLTERGDQPITCKRCSEKEAK